MKRATKTIIPLLVTVATSMAFAQTTITVTTSADAGPGSLRQAILDANEFDAPARIEFALTADDPAYQGSRGVFTIRVLDDLPAIVNVGAVLDGELRGVLTDYNHARLGGGTAGVEGAPLPGVDGPEIEIVCAGDARAGLVVAADDVVIRGVAVRGFGIDANDPRSAQILIDDADDVLIERCVVGFPADRFGAADELSAGAGIAAIDAAEGVVRASAIGFVEGDGARLRNADGWTIEKCEVRGARGAGVVVVGEGFVARGNLVAGNAMGGFDLLGAAGGAEIASNTIRQNGEAASDGFGARLCGVGNRFERNVVVGNIGAGLVVTERSRKNLVSRNSFSNNGDVGVDLVAPSDGKIRVTLNDYWDDDDGANGALNYPLLQRAVLSADALRVEGFASPGATIEFFVVAEGELFFGEGETFIFAANEGAENDLDESRHEYGPGIINGAIQGRDRTTRFAFEIPVAKATRVGTRLTATATVNGETSEFGAGVSVEAAPAVVAEARRPEK